MIDLQSISNVSPKGADRLSLDEGASPEAKRRSAFGLLTRRLTTTFSRGGGTYDDYNGKALSIAAAEDSTTRQIKMQILYKNPGIYRMFCERLVEKCFTHLTVCYVLHHFLDNTLRIPELREDIMSHRLVISDSNRPRAVGLFAYLMTTGETTTSPSTQKKALLTRSPASVSPRNANNNKTTGKDLMEELHLHSSALSIPSLDSTGNDTDDDSLRGGNSGSYSSNSSSSNNDSP